MICKASTLSLMPAQPLATSPQPEGQNPNDGSKLFNPATGKPLVKAGDIPKWGEPDPDKAIHKLAVHVTNVTNTTLELAFIVEP